MKHLAVTIALSFPLLLTLAAAQNNQPDDASAVRATLTNYIEAYYTGDARRMEQTLHPHYLKHMIHGDIPMREKTGTQMVQEAALTAPSIFPEQVSVLDIAGDIASAKLVTPGWTDYVTLEKINGRWKILSVVQRIDN